VEGLIGDFFRLIIKNCYFSLPAALFLMFAARYVEHIAFAVIGFVIGINFVFPLLSNIEFLKSYLTNENVKVVVLVATGVLTAVVLYVLYRYLVFLAALVTVTFVAYYVINFLVSSFNLQSVQYMNWITFGLSVFIGLLAGLTAYRKEKEFARILSVVVGAAIFSVLVLFYLSGLFGVEFKPESLFANKMMIFFYVSLFLLFLFLSAWFTFRKRSYQKTSS